MSDAGRHGAGLTLLSPAAKWFSITLCKFAAPILGLAAANLSLTCCFNGLGGVAPLEGKAGTGSPSGPRPGPGSRSEWGRPESRWRAQEEAEEMDGAIIMTPLEVTWLGKSTKLSTARR